MKVINYFTYTEVNNEIENAINPESTVLTDGLSGFLRIGDVVKKHERVSVLPQESSKIFPWVNTTISNSKRLLLGTHHSIGKLFLQNYLNEFCYKMNRRHHVVDLFDQLLNDAISMKWKSQVNK